MSYYIDESLIGKRIKNIRNAKKISQQELAGKTGIQNTTISAFENGKRIPSLQNLALIAKALGVSIDELYFGNSDVSFIESAPNKGKKIANCIYELLIEQVIHDYEQTQRGLSALVLNKYQPQVLRLVKNLNEFIAKRATYSNPDAFCEQIIESVANEINDAEKAERKREEQARNIRNSSIY